MAVAKVSEWIRSKILLGELLLAECTLMTLLFLFIFDLNLHVCFCKHFFALFLHFFKKFALSFFNAVFFISLCYFFFNILFLRKSEFFSDKIVFTWIGAAYFL